MNAAEPIDALHWTAQTRLRQGWEGLQWQFAQWLKSGQGNDSPQWGWLLPILLWTLRVLGLVLLAVVIFLLAKQVWLGWLGWIHRPSQAQRLESSAPTRSRSDWLGIAQAAQGRQDYHQAFEALYRALLAQIHESGLLRQDAARTDREYIRGLDQLWSLAEKPLHLRDDWVMLFRTHESLRFGGLDIQQHQFDLCRAAYESLAPYLEEKLGL